MMTIAEAFALGLRHHQAGQLPQAEQIYLQILQIDPSHADALHSLGVVAYQAGRPDRAVEYIRRALEVNPWAVDYHSNLGLAYQALGQLDEAIASYRQAIRLRPHFPEAHNNLGMALQVQGKLAEAAECYQQAICLKADYAEAHNNLGVALQSQGHLAEGVEHYRQALHLHPGYADAQRNLDLAIQAERQRQDELERYIQALRLQPDSAEAQYNLGVALSQQGKTDEAIAGYRRAIELKPDLVAAHYNLGVVFQQRGSLEAAAQSYRRVLDLQPAHAEAHNNLGAILRRQGRLNEAIDCFRESLRCKPEYVTALNNWGVTLYEQGHQAEAMACYDRALQMRPDDAEVHLNRSLVLLRQGDFAHGWREYEWRWQSAASIKRQFRQPAWDGSPLEGRTILVHAEQGLGDTLQFIRYAPLVQQRGGRVIVECQPALVRLLASVRGIDRLVAQGANIPDFDLHVPLLSLPRLFGTTLDTIPREVPYVRPEPQLSSRWQQRLAPLQGFTIGVAWQGNPAAPNDAARSLRLEMFVPLAQLEGIHVFSLQKGPGSEQVRDWSGRQPLIDWSAEMDEEPDRFIDRAALMKHLNLVVTVDTAIAHLAGALGVPVWVALPLGPDWRWQLQREDSPWYPTMRLFRQTALGDWAGVIARIVDALGKLLADVPETDDDRLASPQSG